MHRFYCPAENICKDRIVIDHVHEIHHIKDVLRLKAQDKVCVFDGRGNEYVGLIKELSNRAVVMEIKERRFSKHSDIKITLACAIPKCQKMDDIVDKLTQLGVARIMPLKTQRTVVDLDERRAKTRLQHWERIAISAAKQCKRKTLPVIDSIRGLKDVLSITDNFDLKIIPTLSGKAKLLKDILRQNRYKDIFIIIGPEGDFSPQEIDLAKRAGCIPVSMGDLVLRVETAAMAVVSYIRLSI